MFREGGGYPAPIARLGRGGMAEVVLAARPAPDESVQLVVVKMLREAFSDDPEFAAMLRDEGRLVTRLHHPNIVTTASVTVAGGRLAIEMEALEGQTLALTMTRGKRLNRPLPLEAAVTIVTEILQGLHHAHELCDEEGAPMHVVHRDVSPENVFVTYDGCVKVLDFGIAKAAGKAAVTAAGVIKGKVRYMAPEQARGDELDRRVDVFAAGVILWELLTGRRYWSDTKMPEIFRRLGTGEMPPSARGVRGGVPEGLDAALSRALLPNRDERYATAEEFRVALLESMTIAPAPASALAAHVCSLFAEDRDAARAKVERALQQAREKGGLERPKWDPVLDALEDLSPLESAEPSVVLTGTVRRPHEVTGLLAAIPPSSMTEILTKSDRAPAPNSLLAKPLIVSGSSAPPGPNAAPALMVPRARTGSSMSGVARASGHAKRRFDASHAALVLAGVFVLGTVGWIVSKELERRSATTEGASRRGPGEATH